MLPDDYLRAVARATREAGGLLVLDCITSGALWVDMTDLGVDVLITAPQKGWSGSPGAAYVMVNENARKAIHESTSTSFSADLKRWLTITEGYVEGRHAYHATMPTDTDDPGLKSGEKFAQSGLQTAGGVPLMCGEPRIGPPSAWASSGWTSWPTLRTP